MYFRCFYVFKNTETFAIIRFMDNKELHELLGDIKPLDIDWSTPSQTHAQRVDYQREYQKIYRQNKNRQRQISKMYQLMDKYPNEAQAHAKANA